MAYGLERRAGQFVRGALITREIPHSEDLAQLASGRDPRLADRHWVQRVSLQLAQATRTMHKHCFAHNDLKWRNLLVNRDAELYFIDCPTGAFWWGPFLQRRIIKDLACLDKVAKYQLSRTQRLRFYLQYRRRARLGAADKRRIRQILQYFQGANDVKDYIAAGDAALLERNGLAGFDALWSLQLQAVDEPNVERGGWSSVFRLELEGRGSTSSGRATI